MIECRGCQEKKCLFCQVERKHHVSIDAASPLGLVVSYPNCLESPIAHSFCYLVTPLDSPVKFDVVVAKMELPAWMNRETVQIFVIMSITIGFHYFYISNRMAARMNDAIDDTIDDDLQ